MEVKANWPDAVKLAAEASAGEDEMVGIGQAAAQVHGWVAPGFEPLRATFIENFARRREVGAACCIYLGGQCVVDLWGGIRDKRSGAPWQEDTMVLVHSATKGFAAMTLAVAHARGWLDYDERVATYWPEFAAKGKGAITVRQLLAHQAGLYAFGAKVDREVVADLDRLAAVMADETPAYPAATRQAYHALTLGFYQGELIRRIDPQHRSLGRFFEDEIATPLGVDFHIRLPRSIPNERLARLEPANMLMMALRMPRPMFLKVLDPKSEIFRALIVNPGSGICVDEATVYARELEVPSGGGVGTARGMARAYSALAMGGGDLGIGPATMAELTAPARPSANGFFDDGIRGEARFALGFMHASPEWPVGGARAFGAPGAGGSIAFCDPERQLAYAYVGNRMSARMLMSDREAALRETLGTVLAGSPDTVRQRSNVERADGEATPT